MSAARRGAVTRNAFGNVCLLAPLGGFGVYDVFVGRAGLSEQAAVTAATPRPSTRRGSLGHQRYGGRRYQCGCPHESAYVSHGDDYIGRRGPRTWFVLRPVTEAGLGELLEQIDWNAVGVENGDFLAPAGPETILERLPARVGRYNIEQGWGEARPTRLTLFHFRMLMPGSSISFPL